MAEEVFDIEGILERNLVRLKKLEVCSNSTLSRMGNAPMLPPPPPLLHCHAWAIFQAFGDCETGADQLDALLCNFLNKDWVRGCIGEMSLYTSFALLQVGASLNTPDRLETNADSMSQRSEYLS